ncbi:MAG: hypothetical protein IKU84_04320 [Clostridia bacterium]|nr:hypothetical protein [Clostridia bacterium]
MRKPLSFSLVALIAFFMVIGVILLFSFVGSSHQTPDLPSIPDDREESGDTLDYSRVEINKSNVLDIVSAMRRPDAYYVETKSESFFDATSSVSLRRRWVRDGISRIDILNTGGAVTMSTIYTDSTVYYWTPGSNRVLTMSRGNFTANDEQMIMDYNSLLKLPKDSIIDAKLSRISGEQCIYAEAKNSFGYIEKYWISTQTGLLISGQTLKDNKVIYSVSLIDLDLTRPDDYEFTLPNRTVITK